MTATPAAAAAFLGGFLLFTVQMVAGRLLLPWFGGGPAVWTACLLFFQCGLLAGYALAHWARPLPWVGLMFLPLLASMERWRASTSEHPTGNILLLLMLNLGLPYLMLSAGSPALQRRLADYGLYAWSSVGSVAGVVVYLAAAEPLVRLKSQLLIWCALYAVWAILFHLATRGVAAPLEVGRVWPSIRASARWLGLAASGTALLAAATNQLSQEVFVTPFLWVLPLVLYLLTFALAFRNGDGYNRRAWALAAAIAGSVACVAAAMGTSAPLWLHLVAYPAALLSCCRCVHGELAATRPAHGQLTAFYIVIAAGGALGTALVALAAPAALTGYDEMFLAIAACCLLTSVRNWSLLAGAAVAIAAMAPGGTEDVVVARRGFFGVVKTVNGTEVSGRVKKLVHGRVMHGFQYADDVRRTWPTAYYARQTAVGKILSRESGALHVGVVGLGVGTLAAYGRAGDRFRFYEINPQVIEMARGHFTFLRDSSAKIDIVAGDARVMLDREPPQAFDVLVIDAFSSDAIPSHLLTREAFAIYRRHLAPRGIVAFHISNRYVDLAPVVMGLDPAAVRITTPAIPAAGASEATWMVVGADPNLAALASRVGATPRTWTDDFSSVFSIWNLSGE